MDLFKGVNQEHKEGSKIGIILTLVSMSLFFIYIFKEIRVYRTQAMQTEMTINK